MEIETLRTHQNFRVNESGQLNNIDDRWQTVPRYDQEVVVALLQRTLFAHFTLGSTSNKVGDCSLHSSH